MISKANTICAFVLSNNVGKILSYLYNEADNRLDTPVHPLKREVIARIFNNHEPDVQRIHSLID